MNATSSTYGIAAKKPSRVNKPSLKFSIQLLQNADCEAPSIRVKERYTRRPDENVWHGDAERSCVGEVLS
jgi:hypothetical protein